ncbi:MAG: beta-L-arabinofuranosidase domain-containing protein [Verrucomicrobiia bacterium]
MNLFAAAVLAAVVSRAGTLPVVAPQAQPFPLSQVRLLDSPFRDAMLRDQNYLLSLDADRLLRNFRVNAGLPTTAKPYGGWESPDCELRGHSLGHYLSALSLMFASTGDARFKQRADYIVEELAQCQSNSPAAGFHEGYLSAFPESFIDRVENQKPVWAPWYTLHKIMAGLLDANQLCGNAQALEVLTNMADWMKFRVDRLTPEQMQKSLETEQGGMTEVLANLYGVTGNTNYLQLAEAFNHQRVLEPLEHGKDRLNGLHANTQIPKIIGIAREYEFTDNPRFLTAAETFWNAVALDRSYVIGGDSDHEHFFPTNGFAKHLSPETCETCNTYNMLKLTRELFALEPSAVKMDFYERALYNDILGSQDPDTDMFTYFMSLKPGHFKVYSTPENSFWCCVGTGMENHSKYGDTIYFHDADSLFVNLFIASELSWPEKGISVRQETQFPEGDTTVLKIKSDKPVRLALKIRHPVWAVDGVKVSVNGKKQQIKSAPGSYFTLNREWHDGDTVKIQLPMRLHTEILPGVSNEVAVFYGPVVLAGELGTNAMPNPLARNQSDYNTAPDPTVPVFICDAGKLLKHIKPLSGRSPAFRTHGIGRPQDVTLMPFYQLHRQRYSVYWKVLSDSDWKEQEAKLAEAEARRIAAEARVVDAVRPGEQQSETDHKLQGEKSDPVEALGRKLRHACDGGWFSYELKPDRAVNNELVCTWWGDEAGERNFDILVDGTRIASQKLLHNRPGEFWDATYAIPAELTRGKETIVVKFQAQPGNYAGGLFDLHLLRSQ